MKKLAIFDMDGTLFDTKDVNYRSYSEAIEAAGFHVDIDYKYYCDFCNGSNYKVFIPQIVNGISEERLQFIHDYKKNAYKNNLRYARINNHLFDIISLMKSEYTVALVTTASLKNTMDILTEFGKDKFFDFIITQEDVNKTKPDPECFVKAMERADVAPENTIIFEDSSIGLEAAEKSGANYVKVYGFN